MNTPPSFDGRIGSEWTRLAGKPAFQLDKSLEATFYAGWDSDFLYVAVESNKKIKLWLSIDGSGHNGRFETDGVFAGFTDWETHKHSPTSYGDIYSDDALLFIDPDNNAILQRQITDMATGARSGEALPLANSQVFYVQNGDNHTMMIRIPRALGPGLGFSYWKPDMPVIDGLRLTEGRILGFWLTYAPAETATTGQFSGEWSSINEPMVFYKTALVNDAPDPADVRRIPQVPNALNWPNNSQ